MVAGPPVSIEVLAEKIDNLEERLDENIRVEADFRTRLDKRMEIIQKLQIQIEVNRTRAEAKYAEYDTWEGNHTEFHERKEKQETERKERSLMFVAAVTGIVTAVGTISGAIVALIIR